MTSSWAGGITGQASYRLHHLSIWICFLHGKIISKNLKIIFGGVGLVFLLWIFGVFDGGSSKGKGVHRDITEHRLSGNTVYATAYVGYGVNAEYCAKNVLTQKYY